MSPLSFFLKQGFEIKKDQRLELQTLSAETPGVNRITTYQIYFLTIFSKSSKSNGLAKKSSAPARAANDSISLLADT